MKTREALTEAFEEEAEKLRAKAKELLNGKLKKRGLGMPPTFPAYVQLSINEYGSLFVFVPNDPEKLNYVRDRLRRFGWEVGDFHTTDWGSLRTEAELPKKNPEYSWDAMRNSLSIVGLDTVEGATCKTVKIGTTLQEVDVWETRCTEEDES